MLQDRFELNLDPLELENICPFAKSTIRNEVGQISSSYLRHKFGLKNIFSWYLGSRTKNVNWTTKPITLTRYISWLVEEY